MTDPSNRPRCAAPLAAGLCGALLAGCASTAVTLTPSPQAPVCNRAATALVLWSPQWRPDQKDVAAREAAAAAGLNRFFATSGCFARTELRRTGDLGPAAAATGSPRANGALREFTVHWRQGGPGAVKGVASLPEDMAAALRAGLQPAPDRSGS